MQKTNFGILGTIYQQLKQRGFIPSSEMMLTPVAERRLCKKLSNSKSTRSVEYMSNPSERYYEKYRQKYSAPLERTEDFHGSRRSQRKLSLDFDLFNSGINYQKALSELSPRNSSQNSIRSFKSFSGHQRRHSGDYFPLSLIIKKSNFMKRIYSAGI